MGQLPYAPSACAAAQPGIDDPAASDAAGSVSSAGSELSSGFGRPKTETVAPADDGGAGAHLSIASQDVAKVSNDPATDELCADIATQAAGQAINAVSDTSAARLDSESDRQASFSEPADTGSDGSAPSPKSSLPSFQLTGVQLTPTSKTDRSPTGNAAADAKAASGTGQTAKVSREHPATAARADAETGLAPSIATAHPAAAAEPQAVMGTAVGNLSPPVTAAGANFAGHANRVRTVSSKAQSKTPDEESDFVAENQAVSDLPANATFSAAGQPANRDTKQDEKPDDWRWLSSGDNSLPPNASGQALADGQRAIPKPPSSPDSAHSISSGPTPATPGAPSTLPLHPAVVLERMDKAEIRIGLQSENFGAIRLHTSVAEDQVGASVSTSHAGLRDALVVEAASLEKAMARHSLRLDSVQVDANAGGSGFNSFGSNERQPQARPSALPARWPASRQQTSSTVSSAVPGARQTGYRLDVHV